MTHQYEVVVGNIGTIECETWTCALATYREYVSQSESEYGMAGGEGVAIFVDGEIDYDYDHSGTRETGEF